MNVESWVSEALNIPVNKVTDKLSYQSIAQWDSLNHVNLMLLLSDKLGFEISDEHLNGLTTVKLIKDFVANNTVKENIKNEHEIRRGLENIYIDETKITRIDGENGKLEYRGYPIEQLIESCSFEENAYLILNGERPNVSELIKFKETLTLNRILPANIVSAIYTMKDFKAFDVIRVCVSMLAREQKASVNPSVNDVHLAGLDLIAKIPLIMGIHSANKNRTIFSRRLDQASHATFVAEMCIGEPDNESIEVIEKILITHADHCANASSFAARVAAGCQTDILSAFITAMSVFMGRKHGGAIDGVLDLLKIVKTPEDAIKYVKKCWENNEAVMGFGHRIYKKEDPRSHYLRKKAKELSYKSGDSREYEVIEAIVEAMEPYSKLGVQPNVDLYAGIVYKKLGIDESMFLPLFISGRIVGWTAQISEQLENNVLIRPRLLYTGSPTRQYIKGEGL